MYIAPEHVISRSLREHSLWRINFLGDGRGMWLLHPPYRSEPFYQALPDLVRRVEKGDIPDGQRGDFDVNESLLDFSSARSLRTRAACTGSRPSEHLIPARGAPGLSFRERAVRWSSHPDRLLGVRPQDPWRLESSARGRNRRT